MAGMGLLTTHVRLSLNLGVCVQGILATTRKGIYLQVCGVGTTQLLLVPWDKCPATGIVSQREAFRPGPAEPVLSTASDTCSINGKTNRCLLFAKAQHLPPLNRDDSSCAELFQEQDEQVLSSCEHTASAPEQ